MRMVETPNRILYHMEAIDIENEGYVFWDSTGVGVAISAAKGAIAEIGVGTASMPLSEAFRMYAESQGLQILLAGSPSEVWSRIQAQLPKHESFLSRLFRR